MPIIVINNARTSILINLSVFSFRKTKTSNTILRINDKNDEILTNKWLRQDLCVNGKSIPLF